MDQANRQGTKADAKNCFLQWHGQLARVFFCRTKETVSRPFYAFLLGAFLGVLAAWRLVFSLSRKNRYPPPPFARLAKGRRELQQASQPWTHRWRFAIYEPANSIDNKTVTDKKLSARFDPFHQSSNRC
jgi:hypothetical protein